MTYETLLNKLYDAYFSCMKNKSTKKSAIVFSMDYGKEIRSLANDLYNGTYTISKSIVFGITKPKAREVFAANFRDRVVHHFLMNELEWILEKYMIDDSYNCRVGKGVLYGITRLQEQIRTVSKNYTVPAYTLSLDIQGFFMSINKELCFQMVERAMRGNWTIGDTEWWIELTRKIIMNRPEKNCEIHGDERILESLPDNKTLFRSGGKGLPIGNLTSQIFGNFYLTPFDQWISYRIEGKGLYGRYVDDIRITSTDKRFLMKLIPEIRQWLKDNIQVTLHPHKISVVSVKKGVPFIGAIIKPWGIYTANRTVDHAIAVASHRPKGKEELAKWLQRMNSFMGFLTHNKTYAIRWNLYEMLDPKLRRKIICINMKKYSIKNKYYGKSKLSNGYI